MAENYIRGALLGQGTFAAVYKGSDKRTGKEVALKEIFPDEKGGADGKKGLDPTALREIKLLRELRHPHVIGLLDAYPKKKSVVLVLEYMHSDLEAVIKDPHLVLGAADIKSFLQQLLEALAACHSRDIKPNNCLIAPDGRLVLADFGLSRVYGSPDGRLTCEVFARWYRAPELFFGARRYTSAVDIWAAGCIFGELLLRRPLFDGMCDIDVLSKVFALTGTPGQEGNWPAARELPCFLQFTETKPLPLRQVFPAASGDALDLLGRMLCLDPLRRISAAEALRHPYFSNNPAPTPHRLLPRPVKREDAPLAAAGGGGAAVAAKGAKARGPQQLMQRGPQHMPWASGTAQGQSQQQQAVVARPSAPAPARSILASVQIQTQQPRPAPAAVVATSVSGASSEPTRGNQWGVAPIITVPKLQAALQTALQEAKGRKPEAYKVDNFEALFDSMMHPGTASKLDGPLPHELPEELRYSDQWHKHCRDWNAKNKGVTYIAPPPPAEGPQPAATPATTPTGADGAMAAQSAKWAQEESGLSEAACKALAVAHCRAPTTATTPATDSRSKEASAEAAQLATVEAMLLSAMNCSAALDGSLALAASPNAMSEAGSEFEVGLPVPQIDLLAAGRPESQVAQRMAAAPAQAPAAPAVVWSPAFPPSSVGVVAKPPSPVTLLPVAPIDAPTPNPAFFSAAPTGTKPLGLAAAVAAVANGSKTAYDPAGPSTSTAPAPADPLKAIMEGIEKLSSLKQNILAEDREVDAASITQVIQLKMAVEQMLAQTASVPAAAPTATATVTALPAALPAPSAAEQQAATPKKHSRSASFGAFLKSVFSPRGGSAGKAQAAAAGVLQPASPAARAFGTNAAAVLNAGGATAVPSPMASSSSAVGFHGARPASASAMPRRPASPSLADKGRYAALHQKAAARLAEAAGENAAAAPTLAAHQPQRSDMWRRYEEKIALHRHQLDTTKSQLDEAVRKLNDMQVEFDELLLCLGMESAKNKALCDAMRAAGIDPEPILAAIEEQWMGGGGE
ncbi:CDKD1 protein [Gonium pectorale]|uniref:[RNA-polymerase]-subunit kinase n=1 Tax=Gonium pectorale TaxID=33097 RepID=A0A150GY30_GONPE|nr:CDKD1 protein [Gonium pectorale]|eukprot:KXZ54250.1 CDKD1 protein [Gonium pectorale]